jgi:putative transposase
MFCPASYETVRRWSVKFGLAYARKLRHSHPRADVRWHLDEVFVRINGKCVYLWRAVDCEGEVLDVLVQSRRNKQAFHSISLRAECVKESDRPGIYGP